MPLFQLSLGRLYREYRSSEREENLVRRWYTSKIRFTFVNVHGSSIFIILWSSFTGPVFYPLFDIVFSSLSLTEVIYKQRLQAWQNNACSKDICWGIRNVKSLIIVFYNMRCFVIFVIAVCLLFLLKLNWLKNKSFYDSLSLVLASV